MGLGPHPPHRPPHRDDSVLRFALTFRSPRRACARARDRETMNEPPPVVSRALSRQGASGFRRPPPPIQPHLTPKGRVQRVANAKLADIRRWELCPDPIRSDTSCRAIAALPVGTPTPLDGTLDRGRAAAEAIPPRVPASREVVAKRVGPRSPRSTCLRRPPVDSPRVSRRTTGTESRCDAPRLHASLGLARHGRPHRPLAQPAAWG